MVYPHDPFELEDDDFGEDDWEDEQVEDDAEAEDPPVSPDVPAG